MDIGNRILYFLERNELKQKELAEKINVDPAVLNRIIKNRRHVRHDELEAIANVFHISVDELLGRAKNPQGYYLDEETARIANEMKENPGRRVLFDATRNLSPEKIKQVKDFVDFITRED